MNKTLVIGGTGFIGSNLSNLLIKEGMEVTIIRKSKSFKVIMNSQIPVKFFVQILRISKTC